MSRVESVAGASAPKKARHTLRGSTLTEVLVAIMIASIGLVSVATLFPLSILRSVKATQLTAATEARLNAETAIDRYPNMLTNPVITPATPGVNYTNNPQPGNWYPPLSTNAASWDWTPVPQNYVIDPLGFAAIQNLNLTIGNSATANQNRPEHWFGNDLNGGTDPPMTSVPFVDTSVGMGSPVGYGIARYPMSWRPRYPGAGIPAPDLAAAHYLVTLPDSWLLQFDTVGGTLQQDANAPATSSKFTQIILNGLSYPTATPPSPALRLVMFSADGLSSQIRNVTAIVANGATSTVYWTEDVDSAGNQNGTYATAKDVNSNGVLDHYPLPTSFVNSGIGAIRLEAQDPRYTWLLTLRQSGSAGVDVVVFFNRSLENIGTDEVLYPAGFSLGSPQVTVTYPTGNNTATNQPLKPFMKKGGFIFDANNAYWYRISNVVDPYPPPPQAPVPGTAQLTLEVPANASNQNLKNPNTGNQIPPRAMFPRNIVDVYPLGSKP